MEIGEIKPTGVERIKEIRRIAEELEKSQKKQGCEEDNALPRPYHLQDRVTTQEWWHTQQANGEGFESIVVEVKGADELTGTS